MKIELWWIGKTSFHFLDTGIDTYINRLQHYTSFSIIELEDVKNAGKLNVVQRREKEAKSVIDKLPGDAYLVLLDEKGKKLDSVGFAGMVSDHMNYSSKKLIFLIGGAFGFDQALYDRADSLLSLSKLTFSHQMVRLIFVEQLYRAFTIIKNEKYHNS